MERNDTSNNIYKLVCFNASISDNKQFWDGHNNVNIIICFSVIGPLIFQKK